MSKQELHNLTNSAGSRTYSSYGKDFAIERDGGTISANQGGRLARTDWACQGRTYQGTSRPGV